MKKGVIAGLVLAAGESRRMGADKALLEYRHQPFLQVILENLRRAGISRRVVVLGHHAAAIQNVVSFGDAKVVINPDFHLGQSSSLQAGLRSLDTPEVEGALLCLVDHPVAAPETMRQIMVSFARTSPPAVIPVYQGRRGHPVLISRALFPELLALGPQQGANTIMRKYHDATEWVTVDDPGVLLDIDEPGDYQALIRGE